MTRILFSIVPLDSVTPWCFVVLWDQPPGCLGGPASACLSASILRRSRFYTAKIPKRAPQALVGGFLLHLFHPLSANHFRAISLKAFLCCSSNPDIKMGVSSLRLRLGYEMGCGKATKRPSHQLAALARHGAFPHFVFLPSLPSKSIAKGTWQRDNNIASMTHPERRRIQAESTEGTSQVEDWTAFQITKSTFQTKYA